MVREYTLNYLNSLIFIKTCFIVLDNCLQRFWHQGPVLWKTIFFINQVQEMISGWFKRITFMFDYICVWFIENQTPRSLWQEMEPRQWCECWEELLLQMRLRSLAHSDLLFLTGGLWPRGQGPLVENMVYIGLIQAQLKRVYIFLSLGGMFYKCQSGQGEWLLLKCLDTHFSTCSIN